MTERRAIVRVVSPRRFRWTGFMALTFDSVDAALAYFSDQLAEIRAETIATEAVAIVVLQTMVREEIANPAELCESMRAQLSAVRFAGGDADLNDDLRRRAEQRLMRIACALGPSH
jgi:hypothetical protein